MVRDSTLYDRLKVSPDASNTEIMKAYKKLAIQMHPDKNPDDPDANVKFQDLNAAKEILTNQEKRNMYDQVGMDYVNGSAPQQQAMNPEDLFNMFGGGGFPGAGGFPGGHPFGNMRRPQQKENIVINQEVSLEDIYNESTIPISFQQKQMCSTCKGEGSKDGKPTSCGTCDGRGVRVQVIQMGPMIQQVHSPCQACQGSGKVSDPQNNCSTCNGTCYKVKDVRVNIPLKNGLSNGQQIQIPGHGHNLKDGKTDLVIVVNEKPHAVFKRVNNDLCVEVELKLYQAIFGFDKVITHLDNRKLHISFNSKTDHGTVRRIPGEGMKILNSNTNNKGDMIIKFNVNLPMVDNADMGNKLLYLLKTINQDESNNETVIRNTSSDYIKTILLDTNSDPFTNPPQEEQQQQQQHHPHQQQCVHQ